MSDLKAIREKYLRFQIIDDSEVGELLKMVEELEAQLRDIALMAKPVAATAKNTSAVRTGHELGGYIKHYIVPTHLITAIGKVK